MPWESRPVSLNKSQETMLEKIAASSSSSDNEKARALIVLLLGQGMRNKEVSERLGVHENTVVKWRGRWTGDNTEAQVNDNAECYGRPRTILLEDMLNKITSLVKKKPPKPARRWTVRGVARALNLSLSTTQRALVELDINLYETQNN